MTPAKIPAGAHTLATFTNGMQAPFESVTVNGTDIALAHGSVAYLDAAGNRIASFPYDGAGSIVFTVPEQATIFLVR